MIAPVTEGSKYTGHLLLKNIPRTTKKAFKAECAEVDIHMRDCLIILMRRFVYAKRKGENVIRVDAMREYETEDIKA